VVTDGLPGHGCVTTCADTLEAHRNAAAATAPHRDTPGGHRGNGTGDLLDDGSRVCRAGAA
jgi:hypothetical protein